MRPRQRWSWSALKSGKPQWNTGFAYPILAESVRCAGCINVQRGQRLREKSRPWTDHQRIDSERPLSADTAEPVFRVRAFNHSLGQCLPQRDTFQQALTALIANSPGRNHRVNGISVNQRMRSPDLPRDAGAVYRKRAGVVSRHHDDTMVRGRCVTKKWQIKLTVKISK
jgi:hypothetical protein